jgi:hypothetical protein
MRDEGGWIFSMLCALIVVVTIAAYLLVAMVSEGS